MADLTQDVVPKKLSHEEFKKLEIEAKANYIDNLILDSMYEQLTNSKTKLQDLTKAKLTLDTARNRKKQFNKVNERKRKKFIDQDQDD